MRYFGIVTAILVTGCTGVSDMRLAALGSDPVIAEGQYDTGGGITVAIDVRENQGKTMVCGVWAQSDDQAAVTHSGPKLEILGASSIYLEGRALARGLVFLREVPPSESYAGAMAHCKLTERDWRAGDPVARPVVSFPTRQIYVDASDVGADMVMFSPVTRID